MFAGNVVLVCTHRVYQGLVWVFLCHRVGGVQLPFDQAEAVDGLACDLFSAAVHSFGGAGGRHAYQVLPRCLVVDVQDSSYLLLQKLKHDSALIARSEKSDAQR